MPAKSTTKKKAAAKRPAAPKRPAPEKAVTPKKTAPKSKAPALKKTTAKVAARRASKPGRPGPMSKSEKYFPGEIEAKWQAQWEADALYRTDPPDERPRAYILDFYPYPSGDGLSVGHCRNYVPTDALARYYRMRGYNVLHPMGWDAFGLPAENAAIKLRTNPARLIEQYAANYKRQFRLIGISFDWSREINSSHPEYYRWTQWIFLQLYHSWYDRRADKARPIADLEKELEARGTAGIPLPEGVPAHTAAGWKALDDKARKDFLSHFRLAYRAASTVNWDPVEKTVLANEEVINGRGWRSGALVQKKVLMQWFFRITAYADRLLADLETIDWPEHIKLMQRNWIGRSEGAEVLFPLTPPASPSGRGTGGGGIRVFTTRPDTLWGATFMVLSPEHPLVETLTAPDRRAEVEAYVAAAKAKTQAEREEDREKTGVFTGGYAINPVNGEQIPVWVADYVLMGYGTGAIMAVPAHDERDFAFALKYGLPIIPVIARTDGRTKSFALGGTMNPGFDQALRGAGIPFEERQGSLYITIPPEKIERYVELARNFVRPDSWNEVVGARWLFIFPEGVREWNGLQAEREILARAHELEPDVRGKRTVMEMLHAVEFYRDALFHAEYGTMIHSGEFGGTPGDVAGRKVVEWLEATGKGKGRVNYKLRDWGISRQRYWGAPIPIVHTDEYGEVPVPFEDLPVRLPPVEAYEPTDTGESPLANVPEFVDTTLPDGTSPSGGGTPGRRETDTMGTFACSSWYFLRFADPHNDREPFGREDVSYWLPVDVYVGGAEHAVMHLLYARFWIKALHDLGYLPFVEPFKTLRNQGMILGADGEKMSKSKGNVITPDSVVAEYGADALRAYEMFISDFEQATPWNTNGVPGTFRWLRRVWEWLLHHRRPESPGASPDAVAEADRHLRRWTHKTIKKVSQDLQAFRTNTVISALMEFTNALYDAESTPVSEAAWNEARDVLLLVIAPVAPFIAEEVWARLGRPYSVHRQKWPEYSEALAAEEVITLVVQVNGKVRDHVQVPADISEAEAKAKALATDGARRHQGAKEPRKVVYVPGKLVNIVV